MTADKPDDAATDDADADRAQPQGVFGNLPQTRPGARSPRRERAERGPATRAAPSQPKRAAPPPPPPRSKPASERGAEDAGSAEPGEPGGGIEDVAWAGVAAAAEAATIGVRLATRALEAMRDAVDRR